jgi:hypothetical protein
MKKYFMAVVCSALLLTGTFHTSLNAQIRYARGQDVSPTFDGWEQNSDGTYTLHFGYFNRNAEEELDVPVGSENNIEPGGDRGQPTHFYTTRKWWVFKIVVPRDWPKQQRVVWTLTTYGKTSQAKGWLQPEWEVDRGVMAKNAVRDPFLMSTPSGDIDFENLPPSISGPPALTTALGSTLVLTATATDDGRPKPLSDPTGTRQQGVRVRWILYRGPGKVQFDPDIMSQRVYGKPATLTTKVSFAVPGTYRLRAIANDGQLFTTYDVDITVRR